MSEIFPPKVISSIFLLEILAQMSSHKCEKWVQIYCSISLEQKKKPMDSYLRANATVVFMPGRELSEDMSLSSKTIKPNTDYTNPP